MLYPIVLAALTTPAHAMVFEEDAILGFRLDRPADDLAGGAVHVDRVRAHHCSGGTHVDFVIDDTVDPVAGFAVTLTTGGDYCTITAMFDSDIEIDGDGGAFTVVSDAPHVSLNPANPGWVDPGSWEVTAGSMSGAWPAFTMWLE